MSTYIYSSRWGTTQKVSYTSASAAMTTAFGAATRQVRLAPTSACHVNIADTTTPVATSNHPLIYPVDAVIVNVTPGQGLAVIRASGGSLTSANGDLIVTEIA